MKLGATMRRGGPIFVRDKGATISLVPEIAERGWSFGGTGQGPVIRLLDPAAIYVINEKGIERHPIRDNNTRWLSLMLAGFLLAPLQYRLLSRRRRGNAR